MRSGVPTARPIRRMDVRTARSGTSSRSAISRSRHPVRGELQELALPQRPRTGRAGRTIRARGSGRGDRDPSMTPSICWRPRPSPGPRVPRVGAVGDAVGADVRVDRHDGPMRPDAAARRVEPGRGVRVAGVLLGWWRPGITVCGGGRTDRPGHARPQHQTDYPGASRSGRTLHRHGRGTRSSGGTQGGRTRARRWQRELCRLGELGRGRVGTSCRPTGPGQSRLRLRITRCAQAAPRRIRPAPVSRGPGYRGVWRATFICHP